MSNRRPHTIGIDPGKTVGHAWLCEVPTNDQLFRFAAGESDVYTTGRWLEMTLSGIGRDTHVACERFVFTPSVKTPEYDALHFIGIVRYLCEKYGAELSMQAPSDAKAMGTSERLRRLGMWTPGQGHANDAARHVLLSIVSRGWYSRLLLDG